MQRTVDDRCLAAALDRGAAALLGSMRSDSIRGADRLPIAGEDGCEGVYRGILLALKAAAASEAIANRSL